MIAYFILSKGQHPFGSVYERMGNILKGNPVNLKNLNDPDARQFVSKLISHKIKDRPYAAEALGYPYITDVENIKQASKSVNEKGNDIKPNFEQSIRRTIFSSDDDESESLEVNMYDLSSDDIPEGDNPVDNEHYSTDENESYNGDPDDEDYIPDEGYENYGDSSIDYEYEYDDDDDDDDGDDDDDDDDDVDGDEADEDECFDKRA